MKRHRQKTYVKERIRLALPPGSKSVACEFSPQVESQLQAIIDHDSAGPTSASHNGDVLVDLDWKSEAAEIRISVDNARRILRGKRASKIADACFAECVRLNGWMRECLASGEHWQCNRKLSDAVKELALEIARLNNWTAPSTFREMLLEGMTLAIDEHDIEFFQRLRYKVLDSAPGFRASMEARANDLQNRLLRQWILPGIEPSFCYFTDAAIVRFLKINPLDGQSVTLDAVAQCRRRLKLKKSRALPVKHVKMIDGVILLS
jgi:hypothetical protein